ncbi:MAG: hypothetical protein V4691_04220, partial [Pseudomonadota bacterium]
MLQRLKIIACFGACLMAFPSPVHADNKKELVKGTLAEEPAFGQSVMTSPKQKAYLDALGDRYENLTVKTTLNEIILLNKEKLQIYFFALPPNPAYPGIIKKTILKADTGEVFILNQSWMGENKNEF